MVEIKVKLIKGSLASAIIFSHKNDAEIEQDVAYSLRKDFAGEIVKRVNDYESLKQEVEAHRNNSPVFYDNNVEQGMELRGRIEDLESQNRELVQLLGSIKLELEAGGEFTSKYYNEICNAIKKSKEVG